MKRIAVIAFATAILLQSPQIFAQDSDYPAPPQPPPNYQHSSRWDMNHIELGVFADYLRLETGDRTSNYVGAGGRLGVNVHPNLALEGEMSYDFERNYTSTYNDGVTSTLVRTRVRPLTGLFGPKLQFGTSGPVRAFLTGKLGFINFSTSTTDAVTGDTFTGAVSGVGDSGTHLAFYPGGGLEAFAGPIGLRVEVGDEIYLNNGTNNNMRFTAGPVFRF